MSVAVTRSLEEIEALEKHKMNAVATGKKLIVAYQLTKGDIRGKALKQLRYVSMF